MSEDASRFPPPPWEDRTAQPTWPPRAQGPHSGVPASPQIGAAPTPPDASGLSVPGVLPSGRPASDQSSRPAQPGGWGWAPGHSVAASGTLRPFVTGAAGPTAPPSGPSASGVRQRVDYLPDFSQVQTQPERAVHLPNSLLADVPTERIRAQPKRHAARTWPRARAVRAWAVRLAIAATLVALGLRADVYSLAFMSPGGAIAGWTNPPQANNPFANLPPVTNTTHIWTPTEYAAYLTQHMSLPDKLGQMIMIQFYSSAVTPDLSAMIATDHVGGVLLLGRPVQASDRDLNAQLQQLAGHQLLVSIDQEGGPVNRFYAVTGPAPSAGSLTTPDAARAEGVHDAQMLRQYGYNLNLAPIVDVGVPNPVDQFIGRTFSDDPTQVAALAGAYLDGLQNDGSVTAVLKHFPGGVEATYADPHAVMPLLTRTRADWERIDLTPYRTLLADSDVRAIMVTHEMLPAVDPNLPTSLSPTVIAGTLRSELGFDGVVISDDLHMQALVHWGTIAQLSVLAVKAGTDVVADLATPDEVQSTVEALTRAVGSGEITKAQIDASVQRILALKIRMGLIALPGPAHPRPRRPLPDDPSMAQAMMYPERAAMLAAVA